jgi:hypothetical protein
MTRLEAIHDKTDANQTRVEPETKTNQEKMEATDLKELNPEEMESKGEHREVPKKVAVVEPVKGWKKWHRGRKQAAGRRGEPKELT